MTDKTAGPDLTRWLDRGEGRVAYELVGAASSDGRPLVVCVPGMGDLRSSYRLLVPELVAAGYQVATLDLRGHGDSDTTFGSFDDEALASDIGALVRELDRGPAVVLGNSMGAAAAAILAADEPTLVRGLVLLGPFLRNPKANPVLLALFRVLMARWWAPTVWKSYLPSLYAGRKPADFTAYRDELVTALRQPGRAAAFSATTRTTHRPAEERLGAVHVPSLVVMGELDPDFPHQRAEAEWIRDRIGSEVLMVPDCGHYPQSQRPDVTGPAVLAFLDRVTRA
jgi:pimeloyl-ACP methyl ester carboxylesterase